MTVIAVRAGIMAADSKETWGDDTHSTCEKLYRKRIGRRDHVIGTAGGSYSGMVFVDWYGSGKEPPAALISLDLAEDFEVLVWDGRKLYTANHLCRLVPALGRFYAIGSGRKGALAAMHVGATAVAACEAVCKVDIGCGLPVTWMKL